MQPSLLTELQTLDEHISGIASAQRVGRVCEQYCLDTAFHGREVIRCLERRDEVAGVIGIRGRLSDNDIDIDPRGCQGLEASWACSACFLEERTLLTPIRAGNEEAVSVVTHGMYHVLNSIAGAGREDYMLALHRQ
jgi:hypothetical protein